MISLERFAAIRAAIELEERRDRVLDRAGMLGREWHAIERHWLAALTDEVTSGGTSLSKRYLAAFDGALGRGGASNSVLAPSKGDAPAFATGLAEQAGPVASTAHALPSYMIARDGLGGRPAPSLPAVPSPPIVSSVVNPKTDEVDNRLLRRPAAPFAPSPVAGPVAAPFISASRPPAPAPSMTVALGDARPAAPAIPFRPSSASDQPIASVADASSREASGTVLADENEVLPSAPAEPGLPLLSVEQYAWVVAALRRAKGPEITAALARLRLTEASRAKLDAVWRAHMARHPAVKQVFIRALAQHLTGQS